MGWGRSMGSLAGIAFPLSRWSFGSGVRGGSTGVDRGLRCPSSAAGDCEALGGEALLTAPCVTLSGLAGWWCPGRAPMAELSWLAPKSDAPAPVFAAPAVRNVWWASVSREVAKGAPARKRSILETLRGNG
jgi:hypothetical protein